MLLPVTWIAAWLTASAFLPMLSDPISDIGRKKVCRGTSAECRAGYWLLVTGYSCGPFVREPGGSRLQHFSSDGFHHSDPAGDLRRALLRIDAGLADGPGEQAGGRVQMPEDGGGDAAR